MALFDPLVWWLPTSASGSGKFIPGLAKSYKVSADASVYTFKLREDVTFHDGTKFDAKAVKATYDHVVDPATKSKSGLGALGPYKQTKIIDPYTVEISFKAPNAGFLHQQAAGNFGIASPTALEKYGPSGFGNNPVGSGPFKFESYATGDRLSLVKNPDYTWGPAELGTGPAQLDKLVFRIVADDSGRYNALQSGQLQIAMNLPPNTISAAEKSKKYTQMTIPSIGTPLGMPINVTKPPTDDPLVRAGHHVRRRPGQARPERSVRCQHRRAQRLDPHHARLQQEGELDVLLQPGQSRRPAGPGWVDDGSGRCADQEG